MHRWILALVWLALTSGLVIRAVRPGRTRERVRRLTRYLYHMGLRAYPRPRMRASTTSSTCADLRSTERLATHGYDANTVASAASVLAGCAWKIVEGDPESAHDRLRMRGVLPLLADLYAEQRAVPVHQRMRELIEETRDLADARPAIGWDTTTTALRTISLLRAQLALSAVETDLFEGLPWLRGFVAAHESVLAAGRVVEGLGNHRAINVTGRCAIALLLRADGISAALATEFVETIEGQFLRDGGHIERAPHYHLQLLILTDIIRRADAARGGRIGERLALPLARARSALGAMTSPDGQLLRFADASRPFTGLAPAHAIRALRNGTNGAEESTPSRLDDFGIHTLRGEAGRHDWFVAMDCGPLGLEGNPSHGHADTLAFSLHVDGQPCFVDPGTYLYRNTPEARWFKLPEGHNTVHWPQHPSHELGRFFRWVHHPAAPTLLAAESARVSAEQQWAIAERQYRHRRTWTLGEDRLSIRDNIETRVAEECVARLILHPDVKATRHRDGRAVIIAVGSVELEVSAGSDAPPVDFVDCHYAPEYGVSQPTLGLQWALASAAGARELRVTCGLPT